MRIERNKKTDQLSLELRIKCVKVRKSMQAFADIKLLINGQMPVPYGDMVDAECLLSLPHVQGRYFLFTCSCGPPECTGRMDGVRIEQMDDYIRCEDLDYNKTWLFERESLNLQLNHIRNEQKFFVGQFKKAGIPFDPIR